MKALLILILLCGFNISRAGYFKRDFEASPVNSEDLRNRLFSSNFPKHIRFRRNLDLYENGANEYEQNERLIHPHRYWYANSLRKSNPAFRRRFLPARNVNDPNFFKYRHDMYIPGQRTHFSKSDLRNRDFNRNSNNIEINKSFQTKDSKNHFNVRASEDINLSDKIEADNSSSSLDKTSYVKENKRDLGKRKVSGASSAKRLYQTLGRFDLLYLLGLFLIFIPVASITVIIVPAMKFCWSMCKNTKTADKSECILNDVTVESALVNESSETTKCPTESKSLKNIYKNFVSNEIDGEGDTVAKRMKLERWMAQDVDQKPKSARGRYQRNFNAADMDSVDEESSDTGSALDDATQDEMPTENDEFDEIHDDVPKMPERRGKSGKMNGNKRASKQDSQPFNFPDKVITVGRVHYPKYSNPRHIISLVEHPKRYVKRTSYSMVDVVPQRYSRL